MANFKNSLSLWGSNIKFTFQREIKKIKGKKIIPISDTNEVFLKEYEDHSFSCAEISELTTLILYNGLLVKNKIKKDFSKQFYHLIEDVLNIKSGELSFKVLYHICNSYLKSFYSLNIAFVKQSKEMRYIIKFIPGRMKICFIDGINMALDILPREIKHKKVMVISNHSDLIKVQFIRLKNNDKFKDKFDFSLFAINPDNIVENADKSIYFESIDSLRMAILTYQFDVCVIHEDIYSLPLISFVSKLNRKCIIFGDEVYTLFNIVRKDNDISMSNSNLLLSLEAYDKENLDASGETKFLVKPDDGK